MKSFLLTIFSLCILLLMFGVGYYRSWFVDKPLSYWGAFVTERSSPASPREIMETRYGLAYTICMKVKETMVKKRMTDDVILFEPNSYYRDSLHSELRLPEPAVFYYYTGLHGVWTNSPGVEKARLLMRVYKGEVRMEPIGSPEQLQMILARYRKFVPIL